MTEQQLDLRSDSSETRGAASSPSRIVHLDYDKTRVSPKNPRFGYLMTDESLAPLIAEFEIMGQANDAIAELGADGVPEILAGARRREVCRILKRPLRMRVHHNLNPNEAISIAHREDCGSLEVSWWDRSAAWQRMIADGFLASEARLAEAVAEDKSTISSAGPVSRQACDLTDTMVQARTPAGRCG